MVRPCVLLLVPHHLELLFHVSCELELDAAPIQVMFLTSRFVINITVQVVG